MVRGGMVGVVLRRMSKRIYVVAGELSGDAHGAGLLRALKEMVPGLEIRGVGGPEMREAAGPGLQDWVEDAAVMGIWEVLKRYGWFKERFAEMMAEMKGFPAGRPAADRLSRIQPALRGGGETGISQNPHHLLHQPESLGLEQAPHPGDGPAAR